MLDNLTELLEETSKQTYIISLQLCNAPPHCLGAFQSR